MLHSPPTEKAARHSAPPRESTDTLPAYAEALLAFHQAFAPELERAVNELPLEPGHHVLDTPCGDGSFLRPLALKVGETGRVVGLDNNAAYLQLARDRNSGHPLAMRIEYRQGDVYRIPFPNGSFDLVWCAQSMITLDDPVAALRDIYRVLKPGGLVAVMENDEFHHVMLPWPVDVEAAIARALPDGERRVYGQKDKLHAARTLRSMLRKSGFLPRRKRSFVADRPAPLDHATRRFLDGHLHDLRHRVRDGLPAAERATFDDLTDAHGGQYILDQPDLELTYLFSVFVGVKSPHART